ncbi:hypothetical protein ABH922_003790 [Rhodococcus sp. 27YEA15]|uniref:hypothetical protein n=1 Tax=Rhodococcus sp. 27YEA15 TaxID=3156259 RepID=UPI003C7AFAE6
MTPGPRDVAQLRGAVVGGTSGAVSIAAHALGGGSAPSESAMALLVLACVAVGAVVASFDTRRAPVLSSALMLAAGQTVGHATLTVASDHHHGSLRTLPMLTAHVLAIGVCALLVRAAEHGYRVTASTLAAVVAVVLRPWAPAPATSTVKTRYRPKVVLRQLLTSGLGTRGPPAFE